MGSSSPRLEKISAVLSQAISAVLAISGSFVRFALGVEKLATPIILPLIVGGDEVLIRQCLWIVD